MLKKNGKSREQVTQQGEGVTKAVTRGGQLKSPLALITFKTHVDFSQLWYFKG